MLEPRAGWRGCGRTSRAPSCQATRPSLRSFGLWLAVLGGVGGHGCRTAGPDLASPRPSSAPSDATSPASTPTASTSPTTSPPASPRVAAAPPRSRAQVPLTDVRAEAQRIFERVAKARSLTPRGNVGVETMSREGLREHVRKSLYEHVTKDELTLLGRIEASFGVIPAGSDVEQVLLTLLENSVLGLYDPKAKTLFVGDFVPRGLLALVVGHELAHGLQDQHFGLSPLQVPIRHHSDAEAARSFLVEGDAQAAYMAFIGGDEGLLAIDDSVLLALGNQALELSESSPYPVLARRLQLPYADGAATIAKIARTKGWAAVDAYYGNLPTTTEQMLHEEKLTAREAAVEVVVDAAKFLSGTKATKLAGLEGLVVTWHDQLGEAGLLSMLADVEPAPLARRSAAGWGGDHFVVLDDPTRPSKTPVIVGAIAWDTERDAKEFEPSFARYLDRRVGPTAFVLERRKHRVVFALRFPEAVDRKALTQQAWRSTRFGGAKPA